MDAVATPLRGDAPQQGDTRQYGDTPHGTQGASDQASLPGSIVRAGLYGAAWGGAARLWMRYISESPEFTIGGTSFIIGIPTLIALCSVLAKRSVNWRPRARRPSRAIAGFSTVLLGGAAGILMMPTLALGGIFWANRRRFPRLLLVPIAALACAPILAVVQEIPKGRFVVAFPAYLLLVATFIPVYARIYNPARKGLS